MAYFGVTATDAGLAAASDGEGLDEGLRRRLAGADARRADRRDGARLQVRSGAPRCRPASLALRLRPVPRLPPHPQLAGRARLRRRRRGVGPRDRLRLAGDARRHLPSLLRRRRTGFAIVYDRAQEFGEHLAALVRSVQRLAPGRPVDLLAHSLGARVALAALPHLAEAPGRVILLGAAEFDGRAREGLDGRALALAARCLQRHGAGQRPLRPRLRDVRAASRLGGAGRRPRARRRAAALARPAARPAGRDRLDQRARHPAEAAGRPGSATGGSTPAAARSRSTRRSCGGGRAGTSRRCGRCPASRRRSPAGADSCAVSARGRPTAAGSPSSSYCASMGCGSERRGCASTQGAANSQPSAGCAAIQRPTTAQSGTVTRSWTSSSP